MEQYDKSASVAKAIDRPEWTAAKTAGDVGEQLAATALRAIGCNVSIADGTRTDPYDLTVTASIEVKHDRKASVTGNVAVEIANHGLPSGITTSTATAWCYVVDGEPLLCRTAALRELVSRPYRRVPAGEGATVVLVPLESLRRIARTIRRAG